MAKTAADLLTSARYDLRDSGATQYTQPELLDYLVRAIYALESALSKISSDWVDTSDSVTLSATNNYAAQPTRCIRIRKIYQGTTEIYEKTKDFVRHRRVSIGSATNLPTYWAHGGTNILFDYTADQEYTLTVQYDIYSAEQTINGVNGESVTTDIPYNDQFNQALREAIVIMAKNRNNYDLTSLAYLEDFFLSAAMNRVIGRNHAPKRRRLDF